MNFGSKLNRVKQQADRLFLRGDKTDVAGELRYAEDQAEELRILCEGFTKSLEKNINTHLVTEEKKYKKVPENQAAEVLKDSLKELPQSQFEDCSDTPLFKTVLEELIGVELLLGKGVLDFEDKLEAEVLMPFHKLLKEDFPSVVKLKKALKQASQDVTSAKAKVRSSSVSTSQPNKLETYKDELDEAELRLEQIKDTYACDLFHILSKQRELARLSNLYLDMKADHLEKSLQKLNKVLPSIRKVYEDSCCSPVYGIPLHEHLRITGQEIAAPIQICVKRLVEFGVYEEGLLRVAGSSNKIKRLKGLFDAGLITTEMSLEDCHIDYDIHVFAGAFKGYLRELPEPLLSHLRHDEFLEAVKINDHKERLSQIWKVVNSLPTPNFNNLRYVIKFLSLLASFSNENKMTHNNIAIVMAPSLIWSMVENNELLTMGKNMTLGNDYRVLVEQLVEYSDYFFKDLDFGVEPKKPEPPPSPRMGSANGLPGTKLETHRRTGSADFNVVTGQMNLHPESESPKQPHRMKKKPAPRPPQGKANVDEIAIPIPSHPSNDSFMSRSPPAFNVPQPAPRLHYTNSLKRPSVVPPKPPGNTPSPAKPPRPSPPIIASENVDKSSQSVTSNQSDIPSCEVTSIGFETVESRSQDSVDSSIDVILSSDQNKSENIDVTEKIGFSADEKSDHMSKSTGDTCDTAVELRKTGNKNVSNPEFRKSLEGVLKNQPQPQFAQSRHLVKSSYFGESAESKTEDKSAPLHLPAVPIPAQRTLIDRAESFATNKEKPVVPEKPSVISRTTVTESCRPTVPGKPLVTTQGVTRTADKTTDLESAAKEKETAVEQKDSCSLEASLDEKDGSGDVPEVASSTKSITKL